jgi:hypothetical protein
VDHETGSRSQILIDATSRVPWQMRSRLPYRVATVRNCSVPRGGGGLLIARWPLGIALPHWPEYGRAH